MSALAGYSNNDLWRAIAQGSSTAIPASATDHDILRRIVSGKPQQKMNDLLRMWVGGTAKSGDDNRTLLQRKLIANGGPFLPGATENDILRRLVGGGGGGAPDTTVSDWAARAVANGGSPSAGTIAKITTFWNSLKSAGLASKMLHLNICAPDDWATLTTPLVRGTGGFNQYQIANSDDDLEGYQDGGWIQGIQGDAQNALDTGWIPGVDMTANNAGASLYISQSESPDVRSNSGAFFGCRDNWGSNQFWLNYEFDFAMYDNGSDGGYEFVLNPDNEEWGDYYPFTGFVSHSVTPDGNGNIYAYNALDTPTFVTLDTVSGVPYGSPPAVQSMYLFGLHEQDGSLALPCDGALSFVAFHSGLSASESNNLFTAVQALRVSFGGGHV